MKVIIAGSRSVFLEPFVVGSIVHQSGFQIEEVVSGGARGVDRVGEYWAMTHGISCLVFEADWEKYGKRAGPLRNAAMAKYADALIAVWDGKSRGTANMIETMRAL